MCCAGEQLGDLPHPLAPRRLPSFPARRPARSSPYLPALRLPGRPARCGRLGGRAGGPAGGGLPGPGHGAPDLGAAPTRAARDGRRGGRGRRGAGNCGPRSGRSQRPRRAAPRGDCAAEPVARAARSSRLPPRWGPGAPSRAPLSLLPPAPPSGAAGSAAPPQLPFPAAVTLAAPAQRPAACSATPGGWEGPLHPSSFSPVSDAAGH